MIGVPEPTGSLPAKQLPGVLQLGALRHYPSFTPPRPPAGAHSVAPLTIGVVGGSISFCHGVSTPACYPSLLSRVPNITVYNRAFPGVGAAMPSFCLDALLPEHADVLVVETAANDGALGSLTAGSALTPLNSMERLIRRMLLTRPRTHILLLYVCAPYIKSKKVRNLGSGPCEGLYTNLTRHYAPTRRLSEVTLRSAAPLRVIQHLEWSGGGWLKIHPPADAHAAIAQLVFAEAIAHRPPDRGQSMESAAVPPLVLPSTLPTPLHLDPEFERVDEAWRCRTCGWHDCAHLSSPVSNTGFSVQAPWGKLWQGERGYGVGQLRKFGWLGTAAGARVAFAVPSSSQILLAMLCSYENVGVAAAWIAPAGSSFDTEAPNAVTLPLRWRDDSSQQCVVSVGTSGVGPHVVWLQVASAPAVNTTGRNQVKLYGIYTQPALPDAPRPNRRRNGPHTTGRMHAFRDFA